MSTRPRPSRPTRRQRFPIVPAVIGVAAVALIVSVVLTIDGEQVGDQFGSPRVSGTALIPFTAGSADPAVGLPAPEVDGADFDGAPVTIGDDGRAKIILFLAHWCPFCQQEVPQVQRWVDGGALPEGIDLYAVTSSTDRLQPNYPPSRWLEREGWTSPVVVDDEAMSVARAFGLNAFPYWVFVTADGTVWGRTSGLLGPAVLDDVARALAAG